MHFTNNTYQMHFQVNKAYTDDDGKCINNINAQQQIFPTHPPCNSESSREAYDKNKICVITKNGSTRDKNIINNNSTNTKNNNNKSSNRGSSNGSSSGSGSSGKGGSSSSICSLLGTWRVGVAVLLHVGMVNKKLLQYFFL